MKRVNSNRSLDAKEEHTHHLMKQVNYDQMIKNGTSENAKKAFKSDYFKNYYSKQDLGENTYQE